MHKSDFPFFRPVNVVRGCVRCCVPVGVRPLRPFGALPPARRDSFGRRTTNKTAIMDAAWRTEGALRPAQSLLNPH